MSDSEWLWLFQIMTIMKEGKPIPVDQRKRLGEWLAKELQQTEDSTPSECPDESQ